MSGRLNSDLRYLDGADDRQVHLTPDYILTPARRALWGNIDTDPCTEPDNPTEAEWFYTVEDDGLSKSWYGSVWCNPPYGKAREPWVERCCGRGEHGDPTLLLIPAATDTAIWQRAFWSADGVVLFKGRLKFDALRPNRRRAAASHPSSLFGWNVELWHFDDLGIVIDRIDR